MIELDLEGLQKHREQTVSDILELLKTEDRVGCVRYTGYGKSYFVMRRLIEELNEKVMILVPNKFLFNEYSNLYSNNDNVSIMTYHILKNVKNSQLDNLKDVKYVICDECHQVFTFKTQYMNLSPYSMEYLRDFKDDVLESTHTSTDTPADPEEQKDIDKE